MLFYLKNDVFLLDILIFSFSFSHYHIFHVSTMKMKTELKFHTYLLHQYIFIFRQCRSETFEQDNK